MQVGTYPTRNFATLGPSRIQPPFNCYSIKISNKILILLETTGQTSDPIRHLIDFAESCVFSKQSLSLFFII